ncbi:MAG TPA: hypothetical protein VIN59_03740 [Alphaproteobacteria bacterium]
MQIDLLVSPQGDVGLVGNHTFDTDVSGVIFDVAERSLTLEFGQSMDSLRMNIPVADDFVDALKASPYIHVIAVEKQRVMQAVLPPLMKVSVNEDDFEFANVYRGMSHMQDWLARSRFAQSVHRDNLADESSSRGILFDVSPATLKVAPQLAQALAKQQSLDRQNAPRQAPNMAPPSLGPGSNLNMNRIPRPPTSMSDE